ncbi:hypothetical protein GCM10027425_17070 [Alteromonas gracilis]
MSHPDADVVTDDGSRRRGLSPAGTRVLAGVLSVLLVAGVVVAVLQYLDRRDRESVAAEREAALGVANQFALRMDNFKGDDLEAYSQKVNQVLTTRAKTQFEDSFPAFQEIYQQGNATGVGQVRASAIQEIDADSATALVIHDRLVRSDFGDQQQYLRWVVELDRVDGRWLVDKFTAAQ